MLVLSRKEGEKIQIEGGITITVVAITSNRVRIGISAPPNVQVDREEIANMRSRSPHPTTHEKVPSVSS